MFSPPDGCAVRAARGARVLRTPRSRGFVVLGMALLLLAGAGRTQQISLTLDDLTGPGFSVQGISVAYENGAVTVALGAVSLGTQSWKNLKLACAALRLERTRIGCDEAVLDAPGLGEKVPLSFGYVTDKRELDVALKPAKDETWRISLRPGARGNDLSVRVDGGRVLRFAPWLPPNLPKLNAGLLSGDIRYSGSGVIAIKLALDSAGFADATGLHAGEKIGLLLEAGAEPVADHLRWNATLTWQGGEVFWQPLYLKAVNQQVTAAGRLDAREFKIERGALRYPGVGEVAFAGGYDLAAKKINDLRVDAQTIQVTALYETVLKPYLEGSSLADLRTDGRISAQLALNDEGLQSVDVRLDNVSFEDKTQNRFALFEVNGTVPWRADAATQATVSIKGGELLKMPIGAFTVPLNMNGTRFDLKQLRVPLLDGFIDVRDFRARAGTTNWFWQFTGEVGAISMDKLTAALGIPVMYGTLAATLPTVSHVKSTLRVDGALSMKVFDGAVDVKNLVLLDIFGKAPRVQADVTMQNLDLGMVTRTYSFGSITGRIDARVAGLELVNWQPVKFDVKVASSAGEYPRKISQAAVQNITALGGAGAAAAIQRSVLRFFEQFGYDKIGWGCKLNNTVCEMSGVEDASNGYVIVKGGGIPGITVMGYNRQVSWQELLDRIKRVTQGNVKPIVQ